MDKSLFVACSEVVKEAARRTRAAIVRMREGNILVFVRESNRFVFGGGGY